MAPMTGSYRRAGRYRTRLRGNRPLADGLLRGYIFAELLSANQRLAYAQPDDLVQMKQLPLNFKQLIHKMQLSIPKNCPHQIYLLN